MLPKIIMNMVPVERNHTDDELGNELIEMSGICALDVGISNCEMHTQICKTGR
jgi:hypothetical protein